jgi:hypothetical protein
MGYGPASVHRVARDLGVTLGTLTLALPHATVSVHAKDLQNQSVGSFPLPIATLHRAAAAPTASMDSATRVLATAQRTIRAITPGVGGTGGTHTALPQARVIIDPGPIYYPFPDFLAALIGYWQNVNALLTLSPELYYGIAPPGPVWNPTDLGAPGTGGYYPVCVVTLAGQRDDGYTTRGEYWDDLRYDICTDHPDADQAAINGKLIVDSLKPILRQPLRFLDGYQMTFYPTAPSLTHVPGAGPLSNTYVYRQTYTWRAKVGHP